MSAGLVGEFCLRVKMNVNKIITRFVYITNGGEEWYQVKYEKLPIFYGNCELMRTCTRNVVTEFMMNQNLNRVTLF